MRRSSLVVPSAFLTLTVALTGCATGANVAGSGANEELPTPVESSEPTMPESGAAAALAQAQEWLDAANLPPGAVRTDTPSASFNSYTGWPCGPYEELEGYWAIPKTTVVDVANWLIQNPTADLITTNFGPASEEWGPIDSAAVGYIPAVGSQEGIVYTLAKKDDGVAVRAEVAAQTDTATCPPLPDGGMYGAPGQG
ncbi:hypothetical protein GCM10009758_17070 [Microbacterium hatanonis]